MDGWKKERMREAARRRERERNTPPNRETDLTPGAGIGSLGSVQGSGSRSRDGGDAQ